MIKQIFQYGVVLVSLAGAPLSIAQPLEQPPKPGKPKDFTLPERQQVTLQNGMQVTFIPYGSTPKVSMALQFDTGNAYDDTLNGLSDLTFELLTKGTSQMDAGEIARAAAGMGGELSTSVGMHSSALYLEVLSDSAIPAAQLLAQVATESVFAEAAWEKARANMARRAQLLRARPQFTASEAFMQDMYPDHPYSMVFPTEEQISQLELAAVQGFADEALVAQRAHLYVAGVFNQPALHAAIAEAFGEMPAGSVAPAITAPPVTRTPTLTVIDRPDAPQSTIRLGTRTLPPSHPDYISLTVTNTLLGGMFSSRITQNIRENKGYTYSPSSTVSEQVDSSVWYQAADIQAESTGEALNEIIKEITRLQQEQPDPNELQGVKNYMAGIYVLRNSSRYGLIGQLIYLDTHQLPETRLTEYVSLVNAVSAEALQQRAQSELDLATMSLVVVGDDAQMKSELDQVQGLPVIQTIGQ